MRRLLAMFVAMLMLATTAMAEEIDLTTLSDAQLDGLEQAITQERETRKHVAEEEAQAAFRVLEAGVVNEDVTALQQKLADLGYFSTKVDGIFGPRTRNALIALQADLGWEQTGTVAEKDVLDMILHISTGDGVNLACNTSDQWSEWMTPAANESNQTFRLTYFEPGDKQAGDQYACQIEVEFKDVTATQSEDENVRFVFQTQGPVDGAWERKNIWNPDLIRLNEVPEDGIYQYHSVSSITDNNVDGTVFTIGFRCDNWATGSFRVRNIKVEKGSFATDWTEGPTE